MVFQHFFLALSDCRVLVLVRFILGHSAGLVLTKALLHFTAVDSLVFTPHLLIGFLCVCVCLPSNDIYYAQCTEIDMCRWVFSTCFAILALLSAHWCGLKLELGQREGGGGKMTITV